MDATIAAGFGIVLLLLLLFIRWKWRSPKVEAYPTCVPVQLVHRLCPHNNVVQQFAVEEKDSLDEHLDVLTRKLAEKVEVYPFCTPVQLVHRLYPHNNIVQQFAVEEKDSLDEHLDVLTRKHAEKEGRLRVSKLKVRETQHEIESLHAIDHDMRVRYRELMESLRNDLLTNEKECKRIQEQIEWVSRRRAEIRDEVRRGQKLYGEAAMELAGNLTEMQRGRASERVTDKPQTLQSFSSDLRHRKEPHFPRATPVSSIVIKTSPLSQDSESVMT